MTSGDTISRYRILGPLGKGGMGEVYQAEDTRLGRLVALKFLPPDSLADQDKQRFLHEAQAAAAIRHPNICPIYDIEEADGRVFIAMAYLEGETLSRRIGRGPLAIPQAVEIAVQVARGLEKAHEQGIVHRDIKSSNIIVSPDGHVSILDFGLALRSGASRITGAGHAVGTPVYMSPEQARGLEVDGRTDIWSLGVVLFEMLTGKVPFERDHREGLVYAILTEAPPSVTSLRPETPPDLEIVVETALAKQPKSRFDRAGAMAAALERARVDELPTRTMLMAPAPAGGGKRYVIAALAVAALLGGGVVAYEKWRPAAPATPAAAVPVPAPDPRTVAVLPLEVSGTDERVRTIADGLVEILTSGLSGLEQPGGKVIAIPAAEIHRRGIATPEEARRIYGAQLAVTGSIRQVGKTFQITLDLVDTARPGAIASRTFDYDPATPASRDRAIEELAQLVQVNLTPAARRLVAADNTAAPQAYASYLQGRGFLARFDVLGNIDKAIASFNRAAALDPNYALARTGLGEAYWRKARAEADKEALRLALENAERAVSLDPSLAIVHSTLGEIYGTSGREQDAIRELRKAIELAPSNAEAPRELARVYSNLGRFADAEALYLQATKSRPTDWYGYLLLASFYYQQERYQEAEGAYRQALKLVPDNDIVRRGLGQLYLQQGRYREAIEELQQSINLKPNPRTYMTLGATYYYQHRFPEAVSALETAIDLDANGYYYWGNLGIYYKWAPGDGGKAAPALLKAIELAEKLLEVTPNDLDIRADLAEYRARLGEAKQALAEIGHIPEGERQSRASRLAIVYELTGNRAQAIQFIGSTLTNAASLNQIKDDPDLAQLWKDPAFQKAISRTLHNGRR
jgi:eukaryotic-like serine/threonine-protein kinase